MSNKTKLQTLSKIHTYL